MDTDAKITAQSLMAASSHSANSAAAESLASSAPSVANQLQSLIGDQSSKVVYPLPPSQTANQQPAMVSTSNGGTSSGTSGGRNLTTEHYKIAAKTLRPHFDARQGVRQFRHRLAEMIGMVNGEFRKHGLQGEYTAHKLDLWVANSIQRAKHEEYAQKAAAEKVVQPGSVMKAHSAAVAQVPPESSATQGISRQASSHAPYVHPYGQGKVSNEWMQRASMLLHANHPQQSRTTHPCTSPCIYFV